MRTARERGRIPIAYLLYGVLFFCLLISILFPYKRLAETLINRLEKKTGIELLHQDLVYLFPSGCTFDQVEIFFPLGTGKVRAYKGDHLTLQFSLLSLLKRELGLRFQGEAYGGETSGEALLPIPVRAGTGTYHLNVKDVRYEEIVAPFYLRDFKISGRLTGEADVRLQGMDYATDWSGTVHAVLSQGRIRNLFVRGMPLPDFTFQEIEVKADLARGNLKLEDCCINSEVFLGEMWGEIALNSRDVRDSRLNLSVRLKPAPEDPINLHGVATYFNKSLDPDGYYPFELGGTFRYPELH